MFQKLQTALTERPPSKEAILKQADGLRERVAVRHVAEQRIVRGGLIGHDVRRDAPGDERRKDIRGIRFETD